MNERVAAKGVETVIIDSFESWDELDVCKLMFYDVTLKPKYHVDVDGPKNLFIDLDMLRGEVYANGELVATFSLELTVDAFAVVY